MNTDLLKNQSKGSEREQREPDLVITHCILLLWILLEISVKFDIWKMMDIQFGDWIYIVDLQTRAILELGFVNMNQNTFVYSLSELSRI